jgi:hypothetical protein
VVMIPQHLPILILDLSYDQRVVVLLAAATPLQGSGAP